MDDPTHDLAAALCSRIRLDGRNVIVVATEPELQMLGEVAMIAAHGAVDPVVAGRRFLANFAAARPELLTAAQTANS